jgi:hypothetical protein
MTISATPNGKTVTRPPPRPPGSQYQSRIESLVVRSEAAHRAEKMAKAAAEARRSGLAAAKEAQGIAQAIAAGLQATAHAQVATIVTRCLAAIFDVPYTFSIRFEERRGRTEAVLEFIRYGVVVEDPLDSIGGGACDVAAFALRVAALLLARPARRRLLVMDEPFRFLKPPEYYGPRVCAMLEALAADFGVQFIIVQNVEAYRTGTIVRVT